MSRRAGAWLLLALPVLAFLALPMLLALSEGVCCYDDASFAVIAKNLAQGKGYLFTLSYQGDDYSGVLFDPALGQGPVGILPVALAIALFGAGPAVPGLTQVVIEAALLAAIAVLLARGVGLGRATAYLAVSLALVLLVSMRHAEQWYAMLGESVAALLVMLGYLRWCLGNRSVRDGLLAGLCFGLAVMTKSIVAIIAVAFFLHAAAQMLRDPRAPGQRLARLLAIAAGGASVFVMFEAWKLAVLGGEAFQANWAAYLEFASSKSGLPAGGDLPQWLLARLATASSSFYLPLLLMLLSAIVVWLSLRRSEAPLRSLAGMLLVGWLAYAGYWLLMSSGPARYLYVGIVLWCFLLALPLLAAQRRWSIALPVLACLALVVLARGDVAGRLSAVRADVLTEPANGDALRMTRVLEGHDDPRIYTPWWAHVASLEYLAPRAGRFQRWSRVPEDAPFLLLVNQHLAGLFGSADETEERLAQWNCQRLALEGPYLLLRCRQPGLAPGPEDVQVRQVLAGCGFSEGGDYQRSRITGRRVYGSYLRGDADTASCALEFRPGQSLLYRSGPVVDGLRAEVRVAGGQRTLDLPRAEAWRRIALGDEAGIVVFTDAGAGWGQWMAIALADPPAGQAPHAGDEED